MRLEPYLTVRDVARLKGWGTSRAALLRAKRRLLARNRLSGGALLIQLGGPTSPWVTTMTLLRKNAPELVDTPSEALDLIAEGAARVQAEMAELRKANQALRHRVRLLEQAHTRTPKP